MADIATGFSPKAGFTFDSILSFSYTDAYVLLIPKSHTALLIGHYLAVLGIPFGIFGVLQIYNALKPAGKVLSTAFLLIGVYVFVIGTVFHAVLALLATILQMAEVNNAQSQALMKGASDFVVPIGLMLSGSLAIASIIFSIAIYFRQTYYPRWVAFVNPLFVQLAFGSLSLVLNPPFNQLSFIMIYNVSAMIYFLFSTAVLVDVSPSTVKRRAASFNKYPQNIAVRFSKPLRRALQYYFAEE